MKTKIPEPVERTPLDQSTPPRPADIDEIPQTVHPSQTTTVVNRIVLVALVLIALSLGLLLKWSLQSDHILEVHNSPFPARTIREHPTPDGVVILSLDYCKVQAVTGELRMSYVSDTREIFLPVMQEKAPKGCVKTEFPVIIPVNIFPDTYRIKFHIVYDINPLKQGVTQDFESSPFTVVAPGGPGSEKVVPQP